MPYIQLGERYLSANGILECLQQIQAVKIKSAEAVAKKALEAGGGAAAITEERTRRKTQYPWIFRVFVIHVPILRIVNIYGKYI